MVPSIKIATVFNTLNSGKLPTTSSVGSLTAAVAGSSVGCCGNTPLPAPSPLKNPWLEIMVPFTAVILTNTSKVMIATLLAAGLVSARKKPAVVFPGALIDMPAASAETPATSATTTVFNLVLFITYVVFAGIWSLNKLLIAFS